MDPYSFTNADSVIAKNRQPDDPLGQCEPIDAIYTLTVLIPGKPPSKLRQFINPKPDHTDTFEKKDMSDMKKKIVKLKAYQFPLDFRCSHVGDKDRKCDMSCYVLEGGPVDTKCVSEECEGHRGKVPVKEVKERRCFGKKGQRLICVV